MYHGWFHLHRLTRTVRNASENYKIKNSCSQWKNSNHEPFAYNVRASKIGCLMSHATIDISVIYVTAQRCAGGLKELDLRSGSQHDKHIVGFFNVQVQHRHEANIFTVISRYDAHGDICSRLTSTGPDGVWANVNVKKQTVYLSLLTQMALTVNHPSVCLLVFYVTCIDISVI